MAAKTWQLLIIEDNPAHYDLMQRRLQSSNGDFLISRAESLAEAHTLLKKEKFDLILADYKLPDGSGLQILSELPEGMQLPVLIITSQGSEKMAVEVYKSGAMDYLVKSEESFEKLAFTIERTLREWENKIERKKIEKALIDSESKYRTLFEKAKDSIYIIDPTTKYFLDVNQNAVQELGYSREEFLKMRISDIAAEEHFPQYPENIEKVISEGQAVFEHAHLRKGGSWLPVEISAQMVEIDGKNRIMAFVRDTTARQKSEQERQKHVLRLQSLNAMSEALLEYQDLDQILNICLEQVSNGLGADAGSILVYQRNLKDFVSMKTFGFVLSRNYKLELIQEKSFARWIVQRAKKYDIRDLSSTNILSDELRFVLKAEDFHSYYGIPLIVKGNVVGVMELYYRVPFSPGSELISTLAEFTTQIAIAIDETQMFEELQKSHQDLRFAYDSTLEGWASALELRDAETEGHSRRVTDLTVMLASLLKVDVPDLVNIRRGALLHDIGKMGIPDSILLKPGPLNDEEWEIMRTHPVLGYEMLSKIDYLKDALDIPLYHHERWDGNGYPDGLKGEQIPLPARIFAVIDVYDALRSDRPYRKAWAQERAMDHIREQSGKHFDLEVVRVFLEMKEVTARMFGGMKEISKRLDVLDGR